MPRKYYSQSMSPFNISVFFYSIEQLHVVFFHDQIWNSKKAIIFNGARWDSKIPTGTHELRTTINTV